MLQSSRQPVCAFGVHYQRRQMKMILQVKKSNLHAMSTSLGFGCRKSIKAMVPIARPKTSINFNSNRNLMNLSLGRHTGIRKHKNIIQSHQRLKSTNTTARTRNTTTEQYGSEGKSTRDKMNEILLRQRTLPIPRWISPRPFTFTISECCGHASFVLVAVSYALDDFLYLRIIAVAGSTSMLFFTYFHPHGRVLWLPFQWNALFIVINSYRIAKTLYYQNMGNRLDENMKRIKHDYFDMMDITDFAKLTSIAKVEFYNEGTLVVQQGQQHHYIRMVLEGELDAIRDGIKTYSLYEGNFISEGGLHAGLLLTGSLESCCTIAASSDLKSKRIRCLVWNRTELIELLKREASLRRSLKAALSWDIVRKLKGQRHSITDHKVKDPALWTLKRKEQSDDRYAAIVQNIVNSKIFDDFNKRRDELDHYRKIHHIDDESHRVALGRCGWSEQEYIEGRRIIKHQNDNSVYTKSLQ